MRRVLCINDGDQWPGFPHVKFGEHYHVLSEELITCPCGQCFRQVYYLLAEIQQNIGFKAERFIDDPLEETIVVQQEEEVFA